MTDLGEPQRNELLVAVLLGKSRRELEVILPNGTYNIGTDYPVYTDRNGMIAFCLELNNQLGNKASETTLEIIKSNYERS